MRCIIIKLLGGMTKLQHLERMEEMRIKCEKFATDNLASKSGITAIQYDLIGDHEPKGEITVIGSCVSIYNQEVRKINVAPWAVKTIVSGCICRGDV